jgi:hypothetical protein
VRRFVYIFALIILTATLVQAQISSGNNELSFSADYISYDGVDIDTGANGDGETVDTGLDFFMFNGKWGHALTPNHMLGVGLLLFGSDIGDIFDSDSKSTRGELFYIYHFTPQDDFTFYTKLDYLFPLSDLGSGSAEGIFGLKDYFSEHAALYWEVGYGVEIGDELLGNSIRTSTGITVVF